ncbi:MAG: type II secretion system minor pseudopilin GspK [Hydrogenophilaceae bacterium]
MSARTRPSRQRGAAVIVAMLVVALATIAAAGFMFRSQLEWRKFENAANLDQARWILRAAEQWAATVLMDDARNSRVDHRGEAWAQELPPVESEGYVISGRMEEQDGSFNLNNLVVDGQIDEQQLAVFQRLLKVLRLPAELAWHVADWLDSDQEPLQPGSAESAYYLGLTPPYTAADRPLVSVDELTRVKGVDRDILGQLRPFVAALPRGNRVNVNTAPAEVLAALVESLTLDEAQALTAQRDRIWFRDTAEFQRALPHGLSVNTGLATVSSEYFVVRASARHGRISVGSRALLHRMGTQLPTILWRASL